MMRAAGVAAALYDLYLFFAKVFFREELIS